MIKLTKQQIGGDWWLAFDGKPVAKFWQEAQVDYLVKIGDTTHQAPSTDYSLKA